MKKLGFLLVVFSVFFASCNDDEHCNCNNKGIIGKWEVIEYLSVESVLYAKDTNYNPTIEFTKEGTTDIKLDANSCFGAYELGEETTINISDSGCTKICCDSQFSQKFVEMLPQVGSYKIEDNLLKLFVSGWGWIELEWVSE